MNFDNMLNRKLASVSIENDGSCITFEFQDGFTRSFGVEGDCCSHSWIEHLELPGNIKGATLLAVNDSAPITQDHDDHDGENPECIEVYNTAFRTDRGDIILEFRNSSNGYYGGYLVDV